VPKVRLARTIAISPHETEGDIAIVGVSHGLGTTFVNILWEEVGEEKPDSDPNKTLTARRMGN
jgi:hypothetical protein